MFNNPISESVLSSGLEIFAKVSQLFTAMVTLIFIMRVTFLVIKVSSVEGYAELIQDVFFYFILINLFPILLKLIVDASTNLADKISYLPKTIHNSELEIIISNLFSDYPILTTFGKIGSVLIKSLAQGIFTALISMFISASPIFIFMSTLLGFKGGIKQLFGIFIAICLWPVMWNILGSLSSTIGAEISSNPLSASFFYLVVLTLQLLSPLFTYSLIRNMQANLGVSKITKVIQFIKG